MAMIQEYADGIVDRDSGKPRLTKLYLQWLNLSSLKVSCCRGKASQVPNVGFMLLESLKCIV